MDINKEKNIPLCSVCCLSYNHSKFIEENIQSIWAQTYKNIEIIALDDGSSDNSAAILNKLQKKSPFSMQAITQQNTANVSKNCNTLLSRASGKYIVFISCDDKLTETTIQSKIDLMEQNDNLVFVASKRNYVIYDADNTLKEFIAKHLNDRVKTADDLLNIEYENLGSFYIQNAVLKKEVVDAVKGFDEDLLGDDIVIRTKIFLYIQKHPGLTFKITDDFGCYYRLHGNNIHKNVYRQVKLVAQVLERYFPDKKAPLLLKDWIKYGFKSMSFEKALKMLFINQKCSDLLLDNDMQDFILKEYNKSKKDKDFLSIKSILLRHEKELLDFCEKFEKIYIYGIGLFSQACFQLLWGKIKTFIGFIVSDGYRTQNNINGLKVFEISEVMPDESIGIIVAMSQSNRLEVLPVLTTKGFTNFIVFEE